MFSLKPKREVRAFPAFGAASNTCPAPSLCISLCYRAFSYVSVSVSLHGVLLSEHPCICNFLLSCKNTSNWAYPYQVWPHGNLTVSSNKWKKSSWALLWEIFLIRQCEARRPTLNVESTLCSSSDKSRQRRGTFIFCLLSFSRAHLFILWVQNFLANIRAKVFKIPM